MAWLPYARSLDAVCRRRSSDSIRVAVGVMLHRGVLRELLLQRLGALQPRSGGDRQAGAAVSVAVGRAVR